jgi:hypothetical protein
MGLSKYINIKVFLLALVFGLFAVYMTMPDTRKVLVYPTPENVSLLQYKDNKFIGEIYGWLHQRGYQTYSEGGICEAVKE